MGGYKLNQRDVNKIHQLHNGGTCRRVIAKNFNVNLGTIYYVLRNRMPGGPSCCDRCGVEVGVNRARTVRASKAKNYRFCPACHGWVFDAANYPKASTQFSEIF